MEILQQDLIGPHSIFGRDFGDVWQKRRENCKVRETLEALLTSREKKRKKNTTLTLSSPSSPPTTIHPFSLFHDNAFTGTGCGIAIFIFLFR